MPMGLFDNKAITVLTNSMDLRAARHKLLTSNIANQETPGYRAVDINFEDELRRREGGAPFVELARTSRGHMTGYYGASAPRALDRATDLPGFDRNSVGIEAEMARLSENTLMYTVSSKLLKGKFNGLMNAIKEGGI
ncbi:MAG: flagellar basal body rod protein FlgB [Deltaproteobacteria bacterium]|nr:flagellar basal body rod protein FlgB [Deltaproteobacteria bacterium]MCL4872441.1 flagellar basal body rod protein FlgB [bacterium]